ncbi:hypothetical protein N7488_008974 [Penicillium malachiteum]|nr:hypothetical protein N7488_008974 [Penicillium malachiteum]
MTQISAVSAPTSIQDQPLAHEVGLLSLANCSDAKYLGPSSGVPFARLIYESAPQSQGLSLKDWSQTFPLGDSEKRGPRNVQPADLPLPTECHQYAEAYFEVAVFLPFMMHDEVFDLLDNVRSFQETGVWKPAIPISLGFGQAFLLLSLGARLLETKLKTDFDSRGLLAAGTRYATQVQLYDSPEGIQVLLLLTLNSLYNPEGLNAWYLLHTIIASCLDLGLQRSNYSNRDNETTEQRNRRHKRSAIFWSAYSLDRILTTILGRPLTLRDEAIDVEFPGINEKNEVDWGALQWSHDSADVAKPFVPCIYSLRFDRIVAEVKLMIYRVSRVPQRFPWPSDLANWQQEVENSCRTLIQDVENRQRSLRMPNSTYLSLFVVQKLQVKYHSCLMLLYRPSPQIPRPSRDAIQKCFYSAIEIIRISGDLHRFRSMDCTWVAAHSIFIAAITILYCLWTSPSEMVLTLRETSFERVKTAQQLLKYLGNTWSVAHNACEKLERLIPVPMGGVDNLDGIAETGTQLQHPFGPIIRPDELQDNSTMDNWSQHGVNTLVDELGMMREFFDLDWLDDAALSQWQ